MTKKIILKTPRGTFKGEIMDEEKAKAKGFGYYFTNFNKNKYDYKIYMKNKEGKKTNCPQVAFIKVKY